jgi:hypothetical protein
MVFALISPLLWIGLGIADFKFYHFVSILWLATSAMGSFIVFLTLGSVD